MSPAVPSTPASPAEAQYLALLRRLTDMSDTPPRPDRTGVGTWSLFAERLVYSASAAHFPLLTTKRVWWHGVVGELLWMLSGSTSVRDLHACDPPIRIWDEWADENGGLGPVYGVQWRRWECADGTHVDQIAQLVQGLRDDPFSRRHILSAWNVGQLGEMALAPCHMMMQLYVEPLPDKEARPRWFQHCVQHHLAFVPENPWVYLEAHGLEWGTLHAQVYQRSADVFLGLPFNIASYALLLNMLAAHTNLRPGTITHVIGDAHLYANHPAQARTQLARTPRTPPQLTLTPPDDVNGWTPDHIHLQGYHPHPRLKAPIAV